MPNTSHKRGFAAMDPEKQREIAARGGRASHRGDTRSQQDDRSGSAKKNQREQGNRGM